MLSRDSTIPDASRTRTRAADEKGGPFSLRRAVWSVVRWFPWRLSSGVPQHLEILLRLACCRFSNRVGQVAALGRVNVVLQGEAGSARLGVELLDAPASVVVVLCVQRFAPQFANRKRACRALRSHQALDFRRY